MIKRNLFPLVGFLAVCAVASAQPAPPGPRSPGEALRAEGDIPGAIAAFERRYREDPGDQKNVLNLARALSINRRVDDCFKYLAIAVEMDPTVAPLIDPDLVTARDDKRWAAFEDGLVARINAKPGPPIKDVAFARALWKLAAWDQAFFQEVGIAARKTGMKSSVVEAIWKLKFLVQQRSQRELEALVAQKGWPRAGQVGNEAAMAAYLVVMHSNDGAQKKYLPAIRKVCEAGELPWVRYAYMYDRSLFNENLPQRYGTHTRYNEQTRTEELYPLEDESRVDEWRKEIGLSPLQEALEPLKIVFEPRTRKVTDLKGDYLGQPLPGETPAVFARGVVSDELQQHGVPAFSPDGNEVFWQTNRLDSQKKWTISTMTARRVGDRWTAPGKSPYGSGPVFSPDGKRLYFDSKGEGDDAHFVEKQGNRWSEAKSVGIVSRFPGIRYVFSPSIALSGTLYFVGYLEGQAMNLGIYRAELVNGGYAKPELLPPSVNSGKGARNWTPYIAPDESFLLFCSTRGLPASDQGDLFASFRRPDGSWSDGISLGAPINSEEMERFPAVSPDGKFLFFTRDTPGFDEDVYWVSAGIIEKLKAEAIQERRIK